MKSLSTDFDASMNTQMNVAESSDLISGMAVSIEDALSRKTSDAYYLNENAYIIRVIKSNKNYPEQYCPLVLQIYDMAGIFVSEFQKRFEGAQIFIRKLPVDVSKSEFIPLSKRPSFLAKRNIPPSFPKIFSGFECSH